MPLVMWHLQHAPPQSEVLITYYTFSTLAAWVLVAYTIHHLLNCEQYSGFPPYPPPERVLIGRGLLSFAKLLFPVGRCNAAILRAAAKFQPFM